MAILIEVVTKYMKYISVALLACILYACFSCSQRRTLFAQSSLATQGHDTSNTWPTQFLYPQLLSHKSWIVAERHRLLKTVDGGAGWQAIYTTSSDTPNSYEIRGVSFVTDQLGLVILGGSSGGKLLRTEDGGKIWHEVGGITESDEVRFENCFFLDELRGWVVGLEWSPGFGSHPNTPAYRGALLATSDGGKSWRRENLEMPHDAKFKWTLRDIYFLNQQQGWAVGDGGLCFQTRDGGSTWQIAQRLDVDYQSVHFRDINFGWASYSYGNGSWGIAITSNGGQDWRRLNENFVFGTWPAVGVFTDPMHGFVISKDLYRTDNGGENWVRVQSDINQDVSFQTIGVARDGSIVVIGTANGRTAAVTTYDQGTHWNQLTKAED